MTPAVAIVLHDVSQATLPMCKRLVGIIAEAAPAAVVTHLVVPDYHHRGRFSEHVELRQWLDSRIARGDELALHGYYHLDESHAPRTLTSWIARRVLTAGEAEFSALNAVEARQRIERGLALFAHCGWQAAGFVPPAWQMSTAASAVVKEFPLRYSSTANTLRCLSTEAIYRVPCLGFSARSAARRWLSIIYNRTRMGLLRDVPLLRVALHPIDAAHASTLMAWRDIIRQLLSERVAVTKEQLLRRAEQLSVG